MVGGVAGIMLARWCSPPAAAARVRPSVWRAPHWACFWIAAAAAVWTSSRGVDSPGSGHEAVTTALTVVFAVMGAVPLVFTLVVILVGRPALGRAHAAAAGRRRHRGAGQRRRRPWAHAERR